MAAVPPILLSMIACDRVILDNISQTASIIGIVQTINAGKYPARHPRIVLFCEMTNGHGQVNACIRLVDIREDDKLIIEQRGKIVFKDVKQINNLIMDLQGVVFPHEGEYRFQLYVDEQLLGERRIVCRTVSPPGQTKVDGD